MVSFHTFLPSDSFGRTSSSTDWGASFHPEGRPSFIADPDNGRLSVGINASPSEDTAYLIEYSNSPIFFVGTVQSERIDFGSNNIIIDGLATQYKSKCYVRVKKIMKDSTGAEVVGSSWGTTVRASKVSE